MANQTEPLSRLRFKSRKLGRDVELTNRDLRTFARLYTFIRPDFEQLCQLEDVRPSNRLQYQRRLRVLADARFIFVYGSPFSKNPIYALLDKGMRVHLERCSPVSDRTSRRRVKYPAHNDAERIRLHETGNAALAILLERSLAAAGGSFIAHRDIYKYAPAKAVQRRQAVPVPYTWNGEEKTYSLKPDYNGGGYFAQRPNDANTRYFSHEIDCHTEDVEPANPFSGKQNCVRKLLLYEAALEQGVFNTELGIDHVKPMFVFLRPRRRDHVVEVAQRLLTSKTAKEAMHFGLIPSDWNRAHYSQLDWVNGAGKGRIIQL